MIGVRFVGSFLRDCLIGNLHRQPMLDTKDIKQRLDTGADLVILDVRTTNDYIGEQGHIAGAHNIPVEDLQQRMGELADYLEHPIAIVCRTDKKSAKAAVLLTEEGFADVHVVRGGMTKWNKEGLPVER